MSAWDGIEEFVIVSQAGSFTAAAEKFGASVTHMSRAIARLEARLQVQLLHRTTRSLRLTDTGRLFFDHCSRIVEEREEAIAAISVQGEPRGHLRLTCSYALGEKFVAPLVRDFALAYPALSVTVDLDNDVVDIIRGGYDLAIRTGHLEDSRLIGTRIALRALITAAAPAYLHRRGKPADLADLRAHDCLLGSSGQWQFADGVKFRPKGRWQCNSGSAVLDAAIAGMGICQLPAFYLGRQLEKGTLETVLDDLKPADEPIWAVYPQRRHLSPKVSLLVAHLRTQLQPMLDRDDSPRRSTATA
ncbi:LysR family transcriptional regulator [Croceicoccus estronivorus]|uniref:LysR family transcriptional regulator n=1 Tax=Croceicoccus estronivorus TaxID=1172626 RepID=UPI00082B7357|nr:LysR family transcriptional regulator [Croceicoccus estronivorus]